MKVLNSEVLHPHFSRKFALQLIVYCCPSSWQPAVSPARWPSHAKRSCWHCNKWGKEVGSSAFTSAPSHREAFACILNWWFVLAVLGAPWMAWAAKQAPASWSPWESAAAALVSAEVQHCTRPGVAAVFPWVPEVIPHFLSLHLCVT